MYSTYRFWRKAASAITGTSLYVIHICTKNTLIQIHANLLQNLFSPNIVHAKYHTFTLRSSGKRKLILNKHLLLSLKGKYF